MRIWRLGAVVIALAVAGVSLSAHHSFAVFDMTSEKTITGTVSKFEWTNPHTFIFVDVPNDKGVIETWAIEGMSPNYLGRRGWSKTSVKPGDLVVPGRFDYQACDDKVCYRPIKTAVTWTLTVAP